MISIQLLVYTTTRTRYLHDKTQTLTLNPRLRNSGGYVLASCSCRCLAQHGFWYRTCNNIANRLSYVNRQGVHKVLDEKNEIIFVKCVQESLSWC